MINGRKAAVVLRKSIRLPAGSHKVMVMKPGFAVWRGQVTVVPKKTTPVKIDLSMEKAGALASQSESSGGSLALGDSGYRWSDGSRRHRHRIYGEQSAWKA